MHRLYLYMLAFAFFISVKGLWADPIEVRIGEHMNNEIDDSDQILNHPDNASSLQFLKTATPAQLKEQSTQLVGKLDTLFARYTQNELTLAQTTAELQKQELLRGTGYIYIEAPASITITRGIPTLANFLDWRKDDVGVLGTSKGPKDTNNNRPSPKADWNQPGIVYLSPLGVENGFTIESAENLLIAKENLFIMAEEYYHACQTLNDPARMESGSELKYENTLSEFFKNTDNRRDFDLIVERDIAEGDVYAKLVEVLGKDAVINRENVEERYPGRKFIGDRIGLSDTTGE